MKTREEKTVSVTRQSRAHFFDKRLILEVVSAVEDGLPRIEACRKHGMSEGTLQRWMIAHGSEKYLAVKRRVYKASEKRSIIRAVESGMTVTEARIRYGVRSSMSILAWIKQAKLENVELRISNPEPMAKKEKSPTAQQVSELQAALAEAQLKIKALDTLIDIAEEQLKINIRKKSGARQSSK
jgi:transposase